MIARCHYRQIPARFAERKYKHSKTSSMEISGVSSVTAEMTSRVRLIRSGDRYTTAQSISHDRVSRSRSLLLAIRKCKMPPYAIAGGAYGRMRNVDFPTSRMSQRYIKALLLVRRKKEKEKESFCGPERHANVPPIFLSHTVVTGRRAYTDKLYGEYVERRRRSGEDEIANQKGALKVVDALVAHSNAVVARKDSLGIL